MEYSPAKAARQVVRESAPTSFSGETAGKRHGLQAPGRSKILSLHGRHFEEVLSLSAFLSSLLYSSFDQHLVLSGQCSREKVKIPFGSLRNRGNRISMCN